MSTAEHVVHEILALNHGDSHAPITRETEQKLTAGRYKGAGANGALFGGTAPWMEKGEDDLRYLTDHARRRLGL